MKNIRKTLKAVWRGWTWLCTASVTIFVIIGMITIFLDVFLPQLGVYFFEMDSCLDRGGAWNYDHNRCMTQEDLDLCSKQNGIWDNDVNICKYSE